jgi:hypothetical protein
MKLLMLLLLFTLMFVSCNEETETYDYTFLRRQLTPDKQHYLYWYEKPGTFVTSSDYYGLQIMRKDEPFKEHKGLVLDGAVDYWLGKDTLVISSNANDSIHAKDTLPIKITFEKYDNIVIKHIYDHASTGGGINKYSFDSLKVTDNLITFFGVEPIERKGQTTFRYPLGAISVTSIKGTITKIEFDRRYKSMDFTRIDESGKTLHNQPEIGIDSYEFKPKRKITTQSLGQVGIFYDYTSNIK